MVVTRLGKLWVDVNIICPCEAALNVTVVNDSCASCTICYLIGKIVPEYTICYFGSSRSN